MPTRNTMASRLGEFDEIIREELTNGKTTQQIVGKLGELGVTISKSTLDAYLNKTGIRPRKRNNKGSSWEWADDRITKRQAVEKKDSDLYIRGELVDKKKRNKEIARHVSTTAQFTRTRSPQTPEGWAIITPEAYNITLEAYNAEPSSGLEQPRPSGLAPIAEEQSVTLEVDSAGARNLSSLFDHERRMSGNFVPTSEEPHHSWVGNTPKPDTLPPSSSTFPDGLTADSGGEASHASSSEMLDEGDFGVINQFLENREAIEWYSHRAEVFAWVLGA
ncbi:hypothetical protein GGR56DRAFT_402321 [Xylariaceae sp. FL0804]|nr:hypothetical protein GGR56DRAFT_402321 [Xylariaceae sp. FL0804]